MENPLNQIPSRATRYTPEQRTLIIHTALEAGCIVHAGETAYKLTQSGIGFKSISLVWQNPTSARFVNWNYRGIQMEDITKNITHNQLNSVLTILERKIQNNPCSWRKERLYSK